MESKIITVPLGFPLVKENPTDRGSNNIVFMYAGNFSLRKGIHLLLQAWKELSPPNAELWLIGRKELPSVFFEDLPESIKVFSNIPHHDLLIKYRQANVFILPTLADGFGMVITEAMSSGVPVITTWNSGGADLIEEKKNGLVIAPESKEAITEAVRWCLQHKDDLLAMGRHAQAKAVHYPWSAFRKKLIVEIVSKKIEWESKRKSALLHPAI